MGLDTEMRSFELKTKKEVARDLVDMLFSDKMTNFRNGLSFATALVFAVTFSVFTSSTAHSQELNCNVQVMAPRIANVEASVFEALEDGIREFMNGRRWTNDNFNFEERIECTMQINISNAISATQFSGSIQVQSNRPVYASDYNTPMLFVIDGDFEINWVNGTAINFNTGMHRDNLSSILAYYAYMILGMDYDSFGMEAGTEYYLKAQAIVANAQNASGKGWRASEGKQNRYWLVENMLSQTFRPSDTAFTTITEKAWIFFIVMLKLLD